MSDFEFDATWKVAGKIAVEAENLEDALNKLKTTVPNHVFDYVNYVQGSIEPNLEALTSLLVKNINQNLEELAALQGKTKDVVYDELKKLLFPNVDLLLWPKAESTVANAFVEKMKADDKIDLDCQTVDEAFCQAIDAIREYMNENYLSVFEVIKQFGSCFIGDCMENTKYDCGSLYKTCKCVFHRALNAFVKYVEITGKKPSEALGEVRVFLLNKG
jgi:hypothetical protein